MSQPSQQQSTTPGSANSTQMQMVGNVQQENMSYLQQQTDIEQDPVINMASGSVIPPDATLPDGAESSGATEKIILEGIEGEG